jgi:hypothetical protein
MTPFERKEQLKLIGDLITSGEDLAKSFDPVESTSLPQVYLQSMVYKTTNLLSSIFILVSAGQISDSQILARVLVEAKINLAYLLLLYNEEGDKAFVRVLDAILLQKNKAVLNIDWGQEYQTIFPNWDSILSEIKNHYSEEELKKIKQFGLFGCGIEERARKTENTKWYNNAYRIYSKNTHCLDMHEILAEQENNYEYLESREEALFNAIRVCASSIFLTCSEIRELIEE